MKQKTIILVGASIVIVLLIVWYAVKKKNDSKNDGPIDTTKIVAQLTPQEVPITSRG